MHGLKWPIRSTRARSLLYTPLYVTLLRFVLLLLLLVLVVAAVTYCPDDDDSADDITDEDSETGTFPYHRPCAHQHCS